MTLAEERNWNPQNMQKESRPASLPDGPVFFHSCLFYCPSSMTAFPARTSRSPSCRTGTTATACRGSFPRWWNGLCHAQVGQADKTCEVSIIKALFPTRVGNVYGSVTVNGYQTGLCSPCSQLPTGLKMFRQRFFLPLLKSSYLWNKP